MEARVNTSILAEEARVKAWKLHQEIYKTKGTYQESRRHGAPEKNSTPRPTISVGDWEYVMDSGASAHMIGQSSIADTRRMSRNRTLFCLIMTASGTVEEAIVYNKNLNTFLSVKLVSILRFQ